MRINPTPTLATVGGKAYQLIRLQQVGNVPPFFIIAFDDLSEIKDEEKKQIIIQQCQSHGFDLMAVRSSASCEDSPSASFAGMFHTELAVKLPDIIDAITKVLSSVLSKRVADYCETQSISQRNIRMTVIIQKMIASRVSGVCFTKQQNMDKALLIEACYGLGEPLVAGRVTPDSYVLSRDTMQLISMSIGYQKEAMILDEQTRTVLYKEIAFHKRNSRKLTWDELKAIAVTCLHVENCLAFNAADIEWTFEESSFYLLQARPYTAFAPNNMTAFQQRKSYI